jgi:transcriptional pleiotropic regulator of transition state genes
MKATGIVRRIDDLGRIVIPKEIRRVNDIAEGDPMEIYVDKGGEIILKKYVLPADGCLICNSLDKVVEFKGKCICEKCIAGLVDGDYTVPVSIVK